MLTDWERVVQQMSVSEFVTFVRPPDCALLRGHFTLMLNSQSKVSIVFKTCNILVSVDMLNHDGKIFEHFKYVLRMEMQVCLGK